VTIHDDSTHQFTHRGAPWSAGSEEWLGTRWQFDSDVIVYDSDTGEGNEPIYRALVPESE
jgi:hypothetical protein